MAAAIGIAIGILFVWLFRMSRIRILGNTHYARRRAILETIYFGGFAVVMIAALSLSGSTKKWVLAVGFILLFGGYLIGLLRINRRPARPAVKPHHQEEPT